MPQSPACPLPDPSLFFIFYFLFFTDPSLFFLSFDFVLIFIAIIIFSPDQKIQVACHL